MEDGYARNVEARRKQLSTTALPTDYEVLDELMKLSNEYFDVRHNDYLNAAKGKREALNDSQFIEYLYNRAYAMLYLLSSTMFLLRLTSVYCIVLLQFAFLHTFLVEVIKDRETLQNLAKLCGIYQIMKEKFT